MFYSFHFYCIYHLINMKSTLTLLCLVVWVNVDASSAQTEYCGKPEGEGRRMLPIPDRERYENGDQVEYGCLATCKNGEWDKTIKGKDYCSKPEGADTRMLLIPDRERYENGDKIDYGCLSGPNTGSRGKATCKNGEWSKTIECQEVKCNLPLPPTRGTSYTPADRNLFLPDERVTVTCDSGFWNFFSSHTENTITCKEDGKWSSSTTDCERITCGDPRDPLVRSPSRWQRGQLRETQRYNCRTGYKTTNARGVATCTSDGSWTPEPLCEEITCDKPDILNAVIKDPKTRYKINDLLTYECKMNYELLDSTTRATATCTTNGWTKTLGCKEVKCNLSLPPTRGTSYTPADRNLFLPDERVTVTCDSGFWNFFSRQTENTITCKEDGKWSSSTTDCERITCGDPRDPLVRSPSRWQRGQLRETQRYNCRTGYKTTNARGVATCTSDGSWTPEPLCEEITCDKPDILNAVIKDPKTRYKINDLLTYECKMNYELLDSTTRATATCTTNGWTKTLGCKDQSQCGRIPVIPNTRKVPHSEVYNNEQTVTIDCKVGYTSKTKTIKCKDGEWQTPLPACRPQGVQCDPPPKVENAIVNIPYQNKYREGFEVNYECRKSIEIEGHKKLTCENGSWTTPPPTCKQYCGKPEGAGRRMEIADQVLERYENGNQIDYTCISPYKGPGGKATCKNGEWHMPFECNASCPDPPPITNGDFTKEKRDVEGVITEVSYQCSRQFTLSSTGSIRCLNGKWQSPPKCLRPCEISTFDAEYNLQNLPKKDYTAHSEKKTLHCKEGYYHKLKRYSIWNIEEIEVKCDDGELQYGEHIPICSHRYS
ncbi:complement factor H isoform X2 [Oncorhynchus kisutch]|uniref:complement factor H isoform X2 n=1 Tax=Oncorhynchus kisutch TaxID=8019 RepID=UPI0012DC0A6C|nr:complement factor H-like isoform X2 [Oncorhynchus kisutch]